MDNNFLAWVVIGVVIFVIVVLPKLLQKSFNAVYDTVDKNLLNKGKYTDGKLTILLPINFETNLPIPEIITIVRNNLNIKDDISNFQASLYLLDIKKDGIQFAYGSSMKPMIIEATMRFTEENGMNKGTFSFTNYLVWENSQTIISQEIAEKIYAEIQSIISKVSKQDGRTTINDANLTDMPYLKESNERQYESIQNKQPTSDNVNNAGFDGKSDFLNRFGIVEGDTFVYYKKKGLWSPGYKKEIPLEAITLVRFRMVRDINAIKILPVGIALFLAGNGNYYFGAELLSILGIYLSFIGAIYVIGIPTMEVITDSENFYMQGWLWEKKNAEYLVDLLRLKISESNKVKKGEFDINANISKADNPEIVRLETKKKRFRIIATLLFAMIAIKFYHIGYYTSDLLLYSVIAISGGILWYSSSKIILDSKSENKGESENTNQENSKYFGDDPFDTSSFIASGKEFQAKYTSIIREYRNKGKIFAQGKKWMKWTIGLPIGIKLNILVLLVAIIAIGVFNTSHDNPPALNTSDTSYNGGEQYQFPLSLNRNSTPSNETNESADSSPSANVETETRKMAGGKDVLAEEFLVSHYNDIANHNFEQAYSHFDITNFSVNNKKIIVNGARIDENKNLANASLTKFSDLWKDVANITVMNFTKISDLSYSYDTTIAYNNGNSSDIYTVSPMKLLYQDGKFSIIEYSAVTKKDKEVTTNLTGIYYVKTDKTYFSDEPNGSKREGYLISGQEVDVLRVENGFGYVEYRNAKGTVTKGWLELSTLLKRIN